jgi:hypothetical protein
LSGGRFVEDSENRAVHNPTLPRDDPKNRRAPGSVRRLSEMGQLDSWLMPRHGARDKKP